MRIATTLIASALLLGACGDRGTDTEHELDEELIAQIMEKYEPYDDISKMIEEVAEDVNGNVIPKWYNTHFYEYNRETLHGMGVHVLDITYDIQMYEEERPRILQYEYEEDGSYALAGLEWYFEPPGAEALPEQPILFGIPMDGIMKPHIQGQTDHYDIHGFFWRPHESLKHNYFGEFTPSMAPASWWFDLEPALFSAFPLGDLDPAHYEPAREGAGFPSTPGPCIEGAGFPLVHADRVGARDEVDFDTLLVAPDGLLLGVQWTYPDDGTGAPPPMFGQEFTQEGDNWILRVWSGVVTNPDGLFAPKL